MVPGRLPVPLPDFLGFVVLFLLLSVPLFGVVEQIVFKHGLKICLHTLRGTISMLFTALHAGSTNDNIVSRKMEVFLASAMYSSCSLIGERVVRDAIRCSDLCRKHQNLPRSSNEEPDFASRPPAFHRREAPDVAVSIVYLFVILQNFNVSTLALFHNICLFQRF